jgi:hypothetical protein
MKQLTKEMFWGISAKTRTDSETYDAILPYIKDVEETPKTPSNVYIVVNNPEKRIIRCFESEERAYNFAYGSVSLTVLQLNVEMETPTHEWVSGKDYPKGDRVGVIPEQNYILSEPSRLEIAAMAIDSATEFMKDLTAEEVLKRLDIKDKIYNGEMHYPAYLAKIALIIADELIKQSKITTP